MGSVRGRLAPLAGALMALGVVALLLGPGVRDAAAQGWASVAIVDYAFDPVLTGVAVGDTITWTNYGAEHHTVTADDSSFNSGNLAPGESFSQTFAATGSRGACRRRRHGGPAAGRNHGIAGGRGRSRARRCLPGCPPRLIVIRPPFPCHGGRCRRFPFRGRVRRTRDRRR
ncbi:MAG: blue (type 1) copper domain protein [Thermomicrobiales bacterium]|nr:blue (type 1) copper domain protein [Thermomicrobiales bacterium]